MSVELQRPEACSWLSRAAEEPISATAPNPKAWLALEQPGPWGRKAPSSSQLDRELGAELDARAKAAGVTLVLIRRPGRLAKQQQALPRTLFAAHPAAGWLERSVVDDPSDLLRLDLETLAGGAVPGLGRITEDPTVLVCTNGRRDLCCAEIGRARVTELAPTLGDALWESSHLGGHRFAPTVLLLPSGVVLGRASTAQILAAVAGELPLAAYRGRSALAAPAQAAEIAVLGAIGVEAAGSLHVATPAGEGPWEVRVTHT
ncbi:MAG TPA: sucrase ferredoxin, partial [Candidatus Limnocylindria bacterium]|nr:sucrase ferredoxin [Candidatus Limnocylindria bacterium]